MNPQSETATEQTATAGDLTPTPTASTAPLIGIPDGWLAFGICLLLAAATWLVFGQTVHDQFVNFDDPAYIYENPIVQQGVTVAGLHWALTYGEIGHWHPLTWFSHMLDCQLYGLKAGGHHLTNVLLHLITVILLFLLLRKTTGFLWRSAFVAAVFAIHPLRAESVAWVAERKDVLSGVFFLLTLGAYVRSVRHPPSLIRYGAVLGFFTLGLLSKNMLVTTPFVLLLLDYWPLGRLTNATPQVWFHRVAEKIPLLVLSVLSCVATALVPEKMAAGDQLPFALRMENAVVSQVTYLWQLIHPTGLACLYPNPTSHLPLWQTAGSLAMILGITGVAYAFRRTRPWLIVGWLWCLGMMIPVMGIVQISYYSHADRYTYLPQIGLVLALTWLAAEVCAARPGRRLLLGGGAAVILTALIFRAHAQTAYWRNSEALWRHTLACTTDNLIAQNDLGDALVQQGQLEEAITRFQTALQIKPGYAEAHYNLGNALVQQGKAAEAIVQYQLAVQDKPTYVEARNNLANTLIKQGNLDEAIAQFQQALQLKPDRAESHYNLANALFQKGRMEEAVAQFQKVLQIEPGHAGALNNLGYAFLQMGRGDEAIAEFQQAVQLKPDRAEAHFNLGYALLQIGRVEEAITRFQKVLQLKPGYAEAHYHLADALVRQGKAEEAIAHYQQALKLKPNYLEAENDLAWELATDSRAAMRNGHEAVALAERANQLTRGADPDVVGTLAAAYAEAGRFEEAVVNVRQAIELARTAGQRNQLAPLNNELMLYQAGRPYHQDSQ